jgi:mannan endo-1,4-beta-mannosidase
MKFSALLTGALSSLAYLGTTFAAKSFSASNLYYAAGLKDAQQSTLFEGLQSAGVKVVRVWLDGNVTPSIAAYQH